MCMSRRAFGNCAFGKVTAAQGGSQRVGCWEERSGSRETSGVRKKYPNLRSSVLKLGWGAFGNGQGGVVTTNIMKGKVSRSL